MLPKNGAHKTFVSGEHSSRPLVQASCVRAYPWPTQWLQTWSRNETLLTFYKKYCKLQSKKNSTNAHVLASSRTWSRRGALGVLVLQQNAKQESCDGDWNDNIPHLKTNANRSTGNQFQ